MTPKLLSTKFTKKKNWLKIEKKPYLLNYSVLSYIPIYMYPGCILVKDK